MPSRAVAGASVRYRSCLGHPGAIQRANLKRIIARNCRTRFGNAHDFESIRCDADFARLVPIRSYEQLAPWIERAASGHAGVLTEEPVVAFEETGGSTAGSKIVPYTASGLAEFQAGLHAWLDDLFVAFPALATGCFYWAISPACRTKRATSSGIPIGMASDADYFGMELAPHIVRSLAVPPAVGACADIEDWRRLTLTHLLGRENLAMISVWSPTFLIDLLSVARADRDALQRAMAGIEHCGPRRAAAVALELGKPTPDYSRIWPRLAVISCWDQASSYSYAASIRALFPGVRVQGKGLLATEGLISIPLHDQPFPVLALQSGYFEFRDSTGAVRTIETIEDGGEYELILTNASGLYRYAIGDMVKVRGFAERTPMLEFRGRTGGVDLCGEKLTEEFALRVLSPHRLRFSALAVDATAMRYILLVDAAEVAESDAAALGLTVERELQRNPQYAHARTLRQLQAVEVARCTNPASRWIDLRLSQGKRLGDIKPPVLIGEDGARQVLAA